MNLEVYEGATTAKEAVDAGKQARLQRFKLYTDLHSTQGVRAMMVEMSPDESKALNNQLLQAQSANGGFPDYLARRIEESIGLPYGFLDQPYPPAQLRASIARAKRLQRMVEARGPEAVAKVGQRNCERLEQACTGMRGVSAVFYEKACKKLKRLPRMG